MAEPLFSPVVNTTVAETIPDATVTATEVPTEVPVTETPVVEETVIPTETAPVTDPPPPVVTEVIKEVEKIVEKYPEMDEYTKEVFEAIMEGKEDKLLEYLSEKHRDYRAMSDYDAVKAELRRQNPSWTSEDLDLKMDVKYGEIAKIDLNQIDSEAEPDQYAAAEAHNRTVERNQKLLKLDAIESREKLEAGKKEIKLPKIEKPQVNESNQPSAEAIEQGRRDWEALVAEEVPKNKVFVFSVGDDDIGREDVTYTVTEAEKNDDLAFFRELTFPNMLSKLQWVDENGKQNVSKMAGDVRKLEKMNQLISSAYKQGHDAGVKSTVAEVKNIDLTTNNSSSVPAAQADIGSLGFAHLNPK